MTKSLAVITPPRPPVKSSGDALPLIESWRRSLLRKARSGEIADATCRGYAKGMTKFVAWCAEAKVTVVGPDDIRDWLGWLGGKGYKPNTINSWIAGVKSFFAWAFASGELPHDPAAEIKSIRSRTSAHKRDRLSNAEVRDLLAAFDDTKPSGIRNRAIACLMAYTAIRGISVRRADLDHLKNVEGKLVLMFQGKGGAEADEMVVIENEEAIRAVESWIAVRGQWPGPLFHSLSNRSENRRLAMSSIRWIIKSAYRLAGIQGAAKTTHSLRHTAISNALDHGAPIQVVQRMAGHASLNTTMIYVHELSRLRDNAESRISYED